MWLFKNVGENEEIVRYLSDVIYIFSNEHSITNLLAYVLSSGVVAYIHNTVIITVIIHLLPLCTAAAGTVCCCFYYVDTIR